MTTEALTINTKMTDLSTTSTTRLTGYALIASAITMVIGAIFNGISSTDLWAALAFNQMADYLQATDGVRTLLIANISFWILGVFMIGTSGILLTKLFDGQRVLVTIATSCFRVAIPLAIMAFLCMLSIPMLLSPETSTSAIDVASVVGWIGARADDIATALIVGVAPLCLSLAGKDSWMPLWLRRWGYLTGFLGFLGFLAIYMPQQYFLGLLIIPGGLGWMIATGIVLLKQGQA